MYANLGITAGNIQCTICVCNLIRIATWQAFIDISFSREFNSTNGGTCITCGSFYTLHGDWWDVYTFWGAIMEKKVVDNIDGYFFLMNSTLHLERMSR